MNLLKIIDKLNYFLKIILGIFFFLMVIFIFFQVIVRFVFSYFDIHISVPWTEEISRYLMIWSIFIGSSVAARDDRLISFEFLIFKVPEYVGKKLKYITCMVIILFFTYLFYYSFGLFLEGFTKFSPILRIPMSFIYIVIPLSCIITIVNVITLLVEVKLKNLDVRNISSERETIDEKGGS